MVTQRILIRRDKETGEVLSHQLLFDDQTTEHIIIDNLPVTEHRNGYTSLYKVYNDGNVTVVYQPIPKTEIEILKEQLEEAIGLITEQVAKNTLLGGQ
jgi:methylmalonyl-CoA mutase cobalamin-binding subunit